MAATWRTASAVGQCGGGVERKPNLPRNSAQAASAGTVSVT